MDQTISKLDEKMQFFQEMLIQMVNRVEEAIYQAQYAFRNHDVELAKKVITNDWFIDQLQEMVENDGVRLLVSETPYGHYMRHIIAGIKIVSSLERMGDHASHMAKMASSEEEAMFIPFVERISEMALLGATMTRKVVEAFIDVKAEKAIEVALLDDKMDAERDALNADLFALRPETEAEMERILNLFYLTKEMERYGDHVTTICRWIVYMDKGQRPKLNGPKKTE
ncbi:phosphate signaling complex protein PhoU [Sphaerochaeta halotolerans]|jgi:phosphate transport system protein|uniref:Phosphate-specific transport system accessory protein PhoU n=1 Tax=Sphaerochaeta halotolerans TaxID=2293840 RepID=A0A372MJ24_9SPIR|nr:phosphate signaling complex protein PhoU [Sphaerochaeta halotolerans]MBG0766100.1 phosphate signaling complex protein PhoU [Spirochaetaceae bacterium]MDK2860031.1 phosphate transport system protein [Sphaerochaeta sp.]MDN5334629.1 phosphate transport system protein [Sphaerochaeta sp.]MXI85513.1 phosphate signaling complex protein PhoU [Sphaerochaeta halotolerans]RFU95180.1 phosphate transport system regulatory protein PhoU [Sphaerochaeta halotolerans]